MNDQNSYLKQWLKSGRDDFCDIYIKSSNDWNSYLESYLQTNKDDYMYDESDTDVSNEQLDLVKKMLDELELDNMDKLLLNDIIKKKSYAFEQSHRLNELRDIYIEQKFGTNEI